MLLKFAFILVLNAMQDDPELSAFLHSRSSHSRPPYGKGSIAECFNDCIRKHERTTPTDSLSKNTSVCHFTKDRQIYESYYKNNGLPVQPLRYNPVANGPYYPYNAPAPFQNLEAERLHAGMVLEPKDIPQTQHHSYARSQSGVNDTHFVSNVGFDPLRTRTANQGSYNNYYDRFHKNLSVTSSLEDFYTKGMINVDRRNRSPKMTYYDYIMGRNPFIQYGMSPPLSPHRFINPIAGLPISSFYPFNTFDNTSFSPIYPTSYNTYASNANVYPASYNTFGSDAGIYPTSYNTYGSTANYGLYSHLYPFFNQSPAFHNLASQHPLLFNTLYHLPLCSYQGYTPQHKKSHKSDDSNKSCETSSRSNDIDDSEDLKNTHKQEQINEYIGSSTVKSIGTYNLYEGAIKINTGSVLFDLPLSIIAKPQVNVIFEDGQTQIVENSFELCLEKHEVFAEALVQDPEIKPITDKLSFENFLKYKCGSDKVKITLDLVVDMLKNKKKHIHDEIFSFLAYFITHPDYQIQDVGKLHQALRLAGFKQEFLKKDIAIFVFSKVKNINVLEYMQKVMGISTGFSKELGNSMNGAIHRIACLFTEKLFFMYKNYNFYEMFVPKDGKKINVIGSLPESKEPFLPVLLEKMNNNIYMPYAHGELFEKAKTTGEDEIKKAKDEPIDAFEELRIKKHAESAVEFTNTVTDIIKKIRKTGFQVEMKTKLQQPQNQVAIRTKRSAPTLPPVDEHSEDNEEEFTENESQLAPSQPQKIQTQPERYIALISTESSHNQTQTEGRPIPAEVNRTSVTVNSDFISRMNLFATSDNQPSPLTNESTISPVFVEPQSAGHLGDEEIRECNGPALSEGEALQIALIESETPTPTPIQPPNTNNSEGNTNGSEPLAESGSAQHPVASGSTPISQDDTSAQPGPSSAQKHEQPKEDGDQPE